jgi:AAA+ superfamily predicted ATPase
MTKQIAKAADPEVAVEPKKTKSQEVAAEVAALFRARTPIIWIVTREEARVERYLFEAAAAAGYYPRTWDVASGVLDEKGNAIAGGDYMKTPDQALEAVSTSAKARGTGARRYCWIMRDLPPWLEGPIGLATLRQMRNLARQLPGTPRESAQSVVVLSPAGDLPPGLATDAAVIEWPLPDREEIAGIIDAAVNVLPEFEPDPKTGEPDPRRPLRALAAPNGTRTAAVDAAVGLSGGEAASTVALSLITTRRVDPAKIVAEKKRVIAREKILKWRDPLPGGLDAVGGLDVLKTWALKLKLAYTPAARAYGLPPPKGAIFVGVSGCGKTMMSDAIAAAFESPLIGFDFGALKSEFVGKSEGNLRRAFNVIEAIGRCVVLVDEVEKALQGSTSGSADGGVSADQLGAFLSWMQDRKNEAFVIMTSNDVSKLPPELLRKGRFDEIFWVDLPNPIERQAILASALKQYGRDWKKLKINLTEVSRAADTFTGAEIASLAREALFTAFADGGREPTTADLVAAAGNIVPLAETAKEKIEELRSWGAKRARAASSPEKPSVLAVGAGRQLDF